MIENRLITEFRGLAALMVLLFHFISVSNNFLNNMMLVELFHYAKYGVQVFFVISGFILTISLINSNYEIKNISTFLLKRFIRIEPPYIFSIILILSLIYIKCLIQNASTDDYFCWPQVFLHLCYFIPFSDYPWLSIVYWTLAIEFQFYLLLSLVYPLLNISKFVRFTILSLLSMLVFFNDIILHIELFGWIPVFVSGICLAYLSRDIEILDYKLILLILLCDLLVAQNNGLDIALVILITQLAIFRGKPMKINFLYFLGGISYSIYLTHTIIGFLLINMAFKLGDNVIYRTTAFVIICFLVVVFGYYFNKFFEQPFQKIARKIKY